MSGPAAAHAITVTGLSKRYGELTAVDGTSFEVRQDEIFGLLGPNGAGKTTTVEILEGLRAADQGEVMVAGVDVRRHPQDVKAVIGVQLQASAFIDNLNLVELIDMFAALYGVRLNALEMLDRVDLREKAKALVKNLSGGQKQRFSIATALVNDPLVLFLDEPSTGLDPQARRNLWDLIEGLRDGRRSIVLTTHYMEEAERLCDRVAIMDGGRIVSSGTPTELIQQLLARGFHKDRIDAAANLEDVFIDLTGKDLREG